MIKREHRVKTPRTNQVMLRFTDNERALVDKAISGQSLPIAIFARMATLRAAKKLLSN